LAFQPKDIKIVPAGLNLLAPGDQVAPGDCLDLTGWWPGSVGRLQQAPGYERFSAQHLTGYFDAICEASGRVYYAGSGNVCMVGRNLPNEDPINSGWAFDGYALGMIAYRKYCWMINRTHQKKDDGSAITDWTPAAPGSPTLTNPALTSTPVAITECDPATPGTGGYFTEINLFTAAAITALEVGGTVRVAGNGTAAMNDTWTIARLYPTAGASLIVLNGVNASLPPGTVFGMGGTFQYVPPGMPRDDYDYYITWQFVDLGESNPCAVAHIGVTDTGTKVTVSIAALTPAAGATGWNVYRKGSNIAWPYRVNTDVIPIGTTTYDDFGDTDHAQDDTYLTDTLGAQLEGDHDAAPPARIMANQIYNGRIVVANSADYPNRIWYTPALQPAFFRGSGNPQAGDWVDVGTDRGDEVLFMAVKPNQIIVYRKKSIWRVLYDFQDPNGRIEVVVPDLGIVGCHAVAPTSIGDYFRAPEGIYKFNGDWAAKHSAKLDPVFLGQIGENFAGEDPSYQLRCALAYRAGRLWVSYTSAGSTENTDCFIWHSDTDRWFHRGFGVGAFLDIGDSLLGAGPYEVDTLETGYIDGLVHTPLAYQSAYEDCGSPDHMKAYADLVVNHNTAGQTLTVRVRTNKAASVNDVFDLDTTIHSTTLTKQVIPLLYPAAYPVVALRGKPIRAFNLSVRIDGLGALTAPGVVIETPIIIHYYLEARQGMVFDSHETDHGFPGVVKTVDMVEFDIDTTSGPAALQIYSDIPGGAMIPQLGSPAVILQTAGRAILRIVLQVPIDGKLLRYVASTTTGFQVFGFRARITPIGVYLDGTIGETWDTRPIAL
jgi:hypothetical protein